jgi:hypothetical protein
MTIILIILEHVEMKKRVPGKKNLTKAAEQIFHISGPRDLS